MATSSTSISGGSLVVSDIRVKKVTILGSGTSTGVPVIGCDCPVCTSSEPRNIRTRASIMMTLTNNERIVIDTGPEFRLQMLREQVKGLGHVLYTHTHADHCHGFDDLRAFCFHKKEPVQCYISRIHFEEFKTRFSYAFQNTGYLGTKPQVVLTPFGEESFSVAGVDVEPVALPHGDMTTSAFRVGRFVYATDFKAFPEDVIERWRGCVDVMVASGIHFRVHATHSNIPETVRLFEQLQVSKGVVTHLAHDVDYLRDAARLPAEAELAYDGMTIDVPR